MSHAQISLPNTIMPNTGSERPVRKQDTTTTFSGKLPSTKQRFSSSQTSACPSFRIYYYDGAAGSIPFEWETQPGTPKHPSSDLPPPPLTPPPSHFSFSGDQTRRSSKRSTKRLLALIPTWLSSGSHSNNKKSKKLSASSSQSLSERVLIGENYEYDLFKFQTKRKVNRRFSSFDSVATSSVFPLPRRSTSCFTCFIW